MKNPIRARITRARHSHGFVISIPGRHPRFVEGPQGARTSWNYPIGFVHAIESAVAEISELRRNDG